MYASVNGTICINQTLMYSYDLMISIVYMHLPTCLHSSTIKRCWTYALLRLGDAREPLYLDVKNFGSSNITNDLVYSAECSVRSLK